MVRSLWRACVVEAECPYKMTDAMLLEAAKYPLTDPKSARAVLSAARPPGHCWLVYYQEADHSIRLRVASSPDIGTGEITLPFQTAYLERQGYQVRHSDFWGKQPGLAVALKNVIFGQDAVIDDLDDRITAWQDSSRPHLLSTLILGETGAGKTEIPKDVARILGVPLVPFDCNQWKTAEDIYKGLFGDSEQSLASVVTRSPACVVLLDEVDKADRKIWEVLMHILDESEIHDERTGRRVSLRHVLLIMTSNYLSGIAKVLAAKGGTLHELDAQLRMALTQSGTIAPHCIERVDRLYAMRSLVGEESLPLWKKFIYKAAEEHGLRLGTDEEMTELGRFLEIKHQESGGPAGGRARRRTLQDVLVRSLNKKLGWLDLDDGQIRLSSSLIVPTGAIPERRRMWDPTPDRAAAFRAIYKGEFSPGEALLRELALASRKATPKEPVSVVLALGPTGGGKTFLGQCLSWSFGKGEAIKVECQQCTERHMVAPFLFGNPPGYRDSELGGALTRPIMEKKDRVVIFDEFTRAHISLIETIMNVLADGEAVDMGTRSRVDMKQCVFILTTNAYGDEVAQITKEMRARGASQEEIELAIRKLIAPLFNPEHLERIRLVLPIVESPSDDVVLGTVLEEYGLTGIVQEEEFHRLLTVGRDAIAPTAGWRQRKKFFENRLASRITQLAICE